MSGRDMSKRILWGKCPGICLGKIFREGGFQGRCPGNSMMECPGVCLGKNFPEVTGECSGGFIESFVP